MIVAPNPLNFNCKVRVIKEAPGPSVSEEIAGIFRNYNIDIIRVTLQWAPGCLKLPVSKLFAQTGAQAHIKENIKAPRYWPLWGEFTGDRWIPRTKGQ